MGYLIKTKFPNQESIEEQKSTVIKHNEELDVETIDDIINLYNEYDRQGYQINVKYNSSNEKSPFDIANELDMAGIPYKATLKIDNKGDYATVMEIAKIIEQHGFDLTLDIKLKINETSPVNLDDETTWMEDGATYKVTPKVSSDNIDELAGVYESLQNQNMGPKINIKPKKQTSVEDFASQLSVYPDETEIIFTLKEGEI